MQNDAAYGMECQEHSMDLSLKDLDDWKIDDRIWMQKRMDFPSIDLQKHQKRNHFTGRVA
jgi:hypothetical protein